MKKTEKTDNRLFVWSWGGFGLGWLYLSGLRYQNWWLFLLLELAIITVKSNLSTPIYIISSIYLGIYGRRLAWKNGGWTDVDKFLDEQKTWDFCGKFLVGVVVFFSILGIVLAIISK